MTTREKAKKENVGKNNWNYGLVDTVFLVPLTITLGGLMGGIGSLVDPDCLRKVVSMSRDPSKEDIAFSKIEPQDILIFTSGVFYGYLATTGAWIYNLMENPDNPVSYIPLATNLVSAVIQFAYSEGEKKALKRMQDNPGGLEQEVSKGATGF